MIYHGEGRAEDRANLSDLEAEIEKTYETLAPHKRKFDSIIVRGMSGIVVGLPVALKLGKPCVIVRKPGEQAHSSVGVINHQAIGKRALFVDDFISMGKTRKACAAAAEAGGSRIRGSLLYRDDKLVWHPKEYRA